MEEHFSNRYLADIRTVARVECTFMAPEYGSTFRMDIITPFSESSAIVGPNSSQGT